MNNYIKPEIKVVPITLENSILAGSINVPISEDPATGPALSKGNSFFDDENNEGNSGSSSSSLWDD
ncbi:toxin PIN [Prevotella intermedia]|uniref:toxin PIN n=1 Tax=Prevotella intermedia TaxID=28131 RepID=UPI00397E18D9